MCFGFRLVGFLNEGLMGFSVAVGVLDAKECVGLAVWGSEGGCCSKRAFSGKLTAVVKCIQDKFNQ